MSNQLPYNDYHEFFAPDFNLHIEKSNMTNLNSPAYIEDCTVKLMENLRNVQHAPSVQMHDRPNDAMDEKMLKVPKSGVQDTQEHGDIGSWRIFEMSFLVKVKTKFKPISSH